MASQRRGGDGLSFPCSLVGTTVLRLHGKMSQRDRTQAFVRFRQLRAGVMLATDVAARGLNLEGVHWIVQHDLPQDAKEYLHRAGRTARLGQRGQAVLMLHPTERPFLNLLREASVVPKEIKFASLQAALCPDGGKKDVYLVEVALQKQLEAAVSDGAFLHVAAGAAYQSYLRGYAAHSKVVRRLVHVGQLHLGHLAKSFGLKDIPSKLTQQQLKRHATARAAAKGGTEYLAGAEYVPRQQRQEGGGADGKKKKRKGGGTQLNERMRQQKHARPVGSAALVSEFG
jgi:ATP-dependent RNA helicase DDX31/DBP7